MTQTRVAFCALYSSRWMGGVMYLRNLLSAVSSLESKKLHTVVFLGRNAEPEIIDLLSEFADEVVFHPRFQHRSIAWSVDEVFFRLFRLSPILSWVLWRHRVDVLSHSHYTKPFFPKMVTWIPDLQHLHLPEMFGPKEVEERNKGAISQATSADRVVLSSYAALADFYTLLPLFDQKRVAVLRFVISPPQIKFSESFASGLMEKWSLPQKYFFMPNQFWKHKNHQLVLSALADLKKVDPSIVVVFTGHMDDYRDRAHIDNLMKFVKAHQLQKQTLFLGRVSYEEVTFLLIHSHAVINPSLFEGWSTTVEESKMLQRPILLSDIPVHREQAPGKGMYFNPLDAQDLARVMKVAWDEVLPGDFFYDEKAYEMARRKYGTDYQDIILEVSGKT